MTDDVDLDEVRTPSSSTFLETASGLLKLVGVAGLVTTAFGFPAVMYRLNAIGVPVAFLSNADALTAGLIPTVFLGMVYLGLLASLQLMRADTPERHVSALLIGAGGALGLVVVLIPLLLFWLLTMLAVGAADPMLHILHLSYLVHRHEIPQSELLAAYKQLPLWPAGLLFLMMGAGQLLTRYGPRMRWIESVRRWFSVERMRRYFSVCVLLAVIVGLAVTTLTAVALWVITAIAIREFQLDVLSTLTCVLISLTLGAIALCTVLVLGPGSAAGLRNLKPASVALYLVIVVWYSVRLYPQIPQWLGGGRAAAVVLWLSADEAPEFLTKDKAGWDATEEKGGLLRVQANMLYATPDAVVLVGKRVPESGMVISRHAITTLIGG